MDKDCDVAENILYRIDPLDKVSSSAANICQMFWQKGCNRFIYLVPQQLAERIITEVTIALQLLPSLSLYSSLVINNERAVPVSSHR